MFYKKHAFFCTNKKANGTGCGHLADESSFGLVKMQLQAQDMWGEGKIRVSKTACLGRCDEGPICVIYPEAIWYNYVDETDVEEITNSHLINEMPVERLKI